MTGTGRGTLWLHVGTHKTGTTSIQEGLELRRAALAADGVALHAEKNAWALANMLLRPDLQTTPRLGWGKPLPGLKDLQAIPRHLQAQMGPHNDMIISSEEFCMMRTALEAHALLTTLGLCFARIVPVIFLRQLADWQAARADQLRKNGYLDRQRALPDALSADGAWYYDRQAILAFWSGIGQPVVVDYDRACAEEGDVLPAFARAIDRPGLFDGLDLRLNLRSETVS